MEKSLPVNCYEKGNFFKNAVGLTWIHIGNQGRQATLIFVFSKDIVIFKPFKPMEKDK